MFWVVFGVLLTSTSLTYAKFEIAKNLGQCFSAASLKREVIHELEMRRKLQVPNLQLRVAGGYSNNEISNQNPERLQFGGSVRWDDITDRQRRYDSQDVQSQSKKIESKLMLESYWRSELENTYYWKWGRDLKPVAKILLEFATGKLAAGRGSLGSLASSRTYTDLIELAQAAGEFISKVETLDNRFSGCKSLAGWPKSLDFTAEELRQVSAAKSLRLEMAQANCAERKKFRTISLLNETGTWTVSATSSINRNRQLGGDENSFNDIRAGVEVSFPLNFAEPYTVTVDRCDYETRIIATEDRLEAQHTPVAYTLLATLVGQFNELRAKAEFLSEDALLKGVGGPDTVLLGLNLLKLHRALAAGEAKLNARTLPAQIVAHEL